ncbi:hypothetical protein BST28156_04217 [Burkholderia stagnalis]|nr:hypothetical protein BST28156_04217 [Burkholderia stagnalis]
MPHRRHVGRRAHRRPRIAGRRPRRNETRIRIVERVAHHGVKRLHECLRRERAEARIVRVEVDVDRPLRAEIADVHAQRVALRGRAQRRHRRGRAVERRIVVVPFVRQAHFERQAALVARHRVERVALMPEIGLQLRADPRGECRERVGRRRRRAQHAKAEKEPDRLLVGRGAPVEDRQADREIARADHAKQRRVQHSREKVECAHAVRVAPCAHRGGVGLAQFEHRAPVRQRRRAREVFAVVRREPLGPVSARRVAPVGRQIRALVRQRRVDARLLPRHRFAARTQPVVRVAQARVEQRCAPAVEQRVMEGCICDVLRVACPEQYHPVRDVVSVGGETAVREIVVDEAPRGRLRIGVRTQVECLVREARNVVHDLEQAVGAVMQRRAQRRTVRRDEVRRAPEQVGLERADDVRRRADLREPVVFMEVLRRVDIALCRPEGVFHLTARRRWIRLRRFFGYRYVVRLPRDARHRETAPRADMHARQECGRPMRQCASDGD